MLDKNLPQLFMDAWYEVTGERIKTINKGHCYQFALLLGAILGEGTTYHYSSRHCWIAYQGLYYDSDCLDGTANHWEICSGAPNGPIDVRSVIKYWAKHGMSGKVRWDVINRLAVKYLIDRAA